MTMRAKNKSFHRYIVRGDKTLLPPHLLRAPCFMLSDQGIKLLGNGELSKAYTVKVCKVSVSAKSKIEAAGGKIEESATEENEES